MATIFPYNYSYDPAAPMMTVKLGKAAQVTLSAMIDTGADNNRVQVQIGTLVLPGVRAVAIDKHDEPLIGRDVLNHLIVTLDGIAGETEIS